MNTLVFVVACPNLINNLICRIYTVYSTNAQGKVVYWNIDCVHWTSGKHVVLKKKKQLKLVQTFSSNAKYFLQGNSFK